MQKFCAKTNRGKALVPTFKIKDLQPNNEVRMTITPDTDSQRRMKMNHMDKLPTSIFFVIQSFLSNREYRDLMNCNLSTFQSIKRETVIYDLIGSEAPSNEINKNCTEEERQENLLKLIKKVENKSKQIKMRFSTITTNKLTLYSNLFQGIHQLSIYYIYREPSSDNDYKGNDSINFNIFNNIYHVIIMGSLLPIKKIHEGFNHVTKLELKLLESLQCIENINNSKTLKELSITNCKSLTRINFPLHGMKKIEIIDCDQFTTIDGLTDGIELIAIFTMDQFSLSTLQSISSIASNLKLLSLSGAFPPDFQDFHGFRDIRCLSINTILDEESPMIPPKCYLSSFNGTRLNLRGFHFLPDPYNINNNKKNTFEFLQDLTLISCDCFLHFPVMPMLIKLTMIYVSNVQTFPTLMNLQAMNLRSCPDLLSIDPFQPSLHSFEIYDAPLLTSLTFHGSSLESVEINHCPKITDVSSFKTVPNLAIRHCSGITSLQDFAGLSLEEDERDIALVTLPNLISLKGLHNIHTLTLCGMEIKDKGEGIHHIHHLEISNCLVQDISGLSDIRCSLILSQCFRLTRLEKNLQNIPKVFLHKCPSLIGFSGLSGQEIVRIRDFGESQNIVEGLLPFQKQLNIQQIVIENENGEQVFRLE